MRFSIKSLLLLTLTVAIFAGAVKHAEVLVVPLTAFTVFWFHAPLFIFLFVGPKNSIFWFGTWIGAIAYMLLMLMVVPFLLFPLSNTGVPEHIFFVIFELLMVPCSLFAGWCLHRFSLPTESDEFKFSPEQYRSEARDG